MASNVATSTNTLPKEHSEQTQNLRDNTSGKLSLIEFGFFHFSPLLQHPILQSQDLQGYGTHLPVIDGTMPAASTAPWLRLHPALRSSC